MAKKLSLAVMFCLLGGAAVLLLIPAHADSAQSLQPAVTMDDLQQDAMKIAEVLDTFRGIPDQRLEGLPARQVQPFELPTPGIDVMRAKIEETYSIDGIGRDTVELSGWIAVRHSAARAIDGADTVSWNTAVLDTQFVGMEMEGESELFGKVRVTLDRSRPLPIGQVGQIEIPELAEAGLVAQLQKHNAAGVSGGRDGEMESVTQENNFAPRTVSSSFTVRRAGAPVLQPFTWDRYQELTPELLIASEAGDCRASIPAAVELADLGLKMRTERPVLWYSKVDTIPPVGHTASVAIEPVALISAGRKVGTLESGVVKFREVVEFVALSDQIPSDPPTLLAGEEDRLAGAAPTLSPEGR